MRQLYKLLWDAFGPQHWWPADTSFEVLLGAVLTQGTNWSNVERVLNGLKEKGELQFETLCQMSTETLEDRIQSAGYYVQKAKKLRILLDWIVEQANIDHSTSDCSILDCSISNHLTSDRLISAQLNSKQVNFAQFHFNQTNIAQNSVSKTEGEPQNLTPFHWNQLSLTSENQVLPQLISHLLNPKSLNPKSLNQKSLNQKSLNQKSLNQKSLNQKSLNPPPPVVSQNLSEKYSNNSEPHSRNSHFHSQEDIFERFLRQKSQNPSLFRKELLELWGIGPETADSILLYAAKLPFFVVDAYTRRVLNRHGIINESKKTLDYLEIQRLITAEIPKNVPIYNEFHALIVRLAKEYCVKNNPHCETCPIRSWKKIVERFL